jgi:hypothetical protein
MQEEIERISNLMDTLKTMGVLILANQLKAQAQKEGVIGGDYIGDAIRLLRKKHYDIQGHHAWIG